MKRSIFALVLGLICFTGFSQSENIWKRKPWETLKFEKLLKLPKGTNLPKEEKLIVEEALPFVVKLETQMKKLGAIGRESDLYQVEPYKMPCVVPAEGFNSKMPVAGRGKTQPPRP